MDKAQRSESSPKFFSNTNVVKANDDFESDNKQIIINCEKPFQNVKKTMSQDESTNASELTKNSLF